MYKLLAIDIDDTLLRSDRTISKRSVDALAKAKDAGVVITIATGRAYRGTHRICDMCNLSDLPIIAYGGALVAHHPTGSTLYFDSMSDELTRECVSFAHEMGLHLQCYDEFDYYYEEENEYSALYADRLGYSGAVRDFLANPVERCMKCLVIVEPSRVDEIYSLAKERFGEKISVKMSAANFIEFYKPETDKSTALAWLASHMSIDREQIIAIGDNSIDKRMIEYAGLGIAVANASEEIKRVADYVAPSNDDDGVAHVIERFILGRQ